MSARLPVAVLHEVEVTLPNGRTRRRMYLSDEAAKRDVERHRERGRDARVMRRRFVELAPRARPTVVAADAVVVSSTVVDDERRADLILRGVILRALADRLYDLELREDVGRGEVGLAAANLRDFAETLELADEHGWPL